MKRIRCAIYTRKSTEDGLEQDFNSLDAQREACEAYIASQKHEGWELLPDHYDDGGISGGHLERPALQRLMEAIDARQVDQIVVYKIDRLTRSLADFAKLVDRLDAAEASFVSVTQSFNTATSMGRLTLNVLLSFAQFEREVTAERIRDKIAASKRKGLWMGGNVPLGYEPNGRTLTINQEEAETILTLYGLYEEWGTMSLVQEAAGRLQLRSKLRRTPDGNLRGGKIMSRGQLHHILTNPIYAGRIRHKGQVFDGQHPAIIDPERWDALQVQLSGKAAKPRNTRQHRDPSPLAGKIIDEAGERLTPSHAQKGKKRYRYYISQKLVTGVTQADEKQRTWRIPAHQLEGAIANAVQKRVRRLTNEANDQKFPGTEAPIADATEALIVVERVRIAPGSLTVDLSANQLQEHVGAALECVPDDLTLDLPFSERRRGVEMKIVVGDGSANIRFEIPLRDGSGDRLVARFHPGRKPVPAMVLVPGLTGCEASRYVLQSAGAWLLSGAPIVRLNLRGSPPGRSVARGHYHMDRVRDLADACLAVADLDPGIRDRGIAIVGFSLGGALALRLASAPYLPAMVKTVVVVSAPLDLAAAADRIARPRNRLYERWLLARLRQETEPVWRDSPVSVRAALARARHVRDFDDAFTAMDAGFRDAADYYASCSPIRGIDALRIPTLLLHAADDPWVPPPSITERPPLRVIVTRGGGHVEFHGTGSRLPWYVCAAAAFVRECMNAP